MADFVREVMTPGVVAVRPDASLVEAAQRMRAQGIGDVVVADGQHVVGVLTDRDITVRAVADGVDPLMVSAQSVCTPDPVPVGPETPCRRPWRSCARTPCVGCRCGGRAAGRDGEPR
jgi:predicted transcriptional regulator